MKEQPFNLKIGEYDFRIRPFNAFSGAGVFLFATKKIVPLLKSLNIGIEDALDMETDQVLSHVADLIGPVIDNISEDELKKFMSNCLGQVDVLLPAGYVPLYRGDTFAVEEIEYSTKICFVLCFHALKPILQDFFGDKDWRSILTASKNTKQ